MGNSELVLSEFVLNSRHAGPGASGVGLGVAALAPLCVDCGRSGEYPREATFSAQVADLRAVSSALDVLPR